MVFKSMGEDVVKERCYVAFEDYDVGCCCCLEFDCCVGEREAGVLDGYSLGNGRY